MFKPTRMLEKKQGKYAGRRKKLYEEELEELQEKYKRNDVKNSTRLYKR
jgi:hypothetical protein